ncbi:MAG: septation protein A [Paracoccaceae bacterium]
MSENNKERPFSKLVLEMGPLIIFFVCYYKAPIPENIVNDLDAANLFKIIFATKIFVPTILIALFIGWLQTKKIAKMPLITAILVVIFGGLTIWLNNPIFIKMKPTLIYLIFALVLGYGLLKKKSYLKILMGSSIPMSEEGWLLLSKRFVVFFILIALLNEIIWRFFSQDFWVNFKTFGLPILLILFMALQFNLFSKYSNKLNKDSE